ncbi:MAG: hypothetical protein CVU55_00090 [Deltaproteobacteria bacterium HGW-Deltaproteobacteria-13]|nr:MAG: hypothetical protein CVU55_00090 [Deltaproteobacteria bacterium HGW-Deltaproteobacteria-13]
MTESSEETKPYAIKFEHRAGYLYVYAHAEKDSFDISLGLWKDVASYCRANGFSKVLVEEDFGTDNDMTDAYEIMAEARNVGFGGIRIAFVDRHPDQMDSNLFSETVVRNRGISAKVFATVKEAEEWLLL